MMKRKSIGTHYSMCVQPAFLIGTYHEDGSPDFAPITWVSATCEGDDYLLVISMFGDKQTKRNVQRTRQLSVNLISTDMLALTDYFGHTSGRNGAKTALPYGWADGDAVRAPVLDCSRWVYECEVAESVQTGCSDTFFCRIRNIQLEEGIEIGDTFSIDLTQLDPVVYSGQYHSIGKRLGKIGDFCKA
ncbi:MAG: flavin reductase [Eubacteriales bacterium]|nr:flavin reductase [Eubacteriales bacterium]